MTRSILTMTTATLAVVALCACHPKSLAAVKDDMVHGGIHVATSGTLDRPVTVAAALQCPDAQGAFKRTAQAADGRSCVYASDKGQIELTLLPGAATDAKGALAPIKARLDAMMPAQAQGGTVNVVSQTGADGRERTSVDLPFLHVRDDGAHSHVKLLGMTIDSDDDDHRHQGNTTDSPAVKTPGGIEDVYVLASDKATSEGFHAIGYVARGGLSGGLVVGTFKYRNNERSFARAGNGERGDHDLDALMDLNAHKG